MTDRPENLLNIGEKVNIKPYHGSDVIDEVEIVGVFHPIIGHTVRDDLHMQWCYAIKSTINPDYPIGIGHQELIGKMVKND